MSTVTYFEHYPHYMGTKNATVKFTQKQFDELIALAKVAIKANKADADFDIEDAEIFNVIEAIEKKEKVTLYALADALVNFFDSPRRPSTITTALKKKGVWSGEWEEGSFAFSNKGAAAAKKAVAKIEAKHTMDEF